MTITTPPRILRSVRHEPPATVGAVLVVTDGSRRAEQIVRSSLQNGRSVVVLGRHAHDVVPFFDAALHGRVWPVVADPDDPAQIADVISRAPQHVGAVSLVVDPSGSLSDVDAADALIG
ncbi:MAG: hypothetical protein QM658_02985 [Gordonia sp. (in: high G+C Gram-positive bacteria)]